MSQGTVSEGKAVAGEVVVSVLAELTVFLEACCVCTGLTAVCCYCY